MTIMDTLRRLSGREPASPAAGTASPREANPWRGVFDPKCAGPALPARLPPAARHFLRYRWQPFNRPPLRLLPCSSNPNAGGREMYDTVDDPKSSPTTWCAVAQTSCKPQTHSVACVTCRRQAAPCPTQNPPASAAPPAPAPLCRDYHLQAEKAAATDVKQAAFQAMGAQSEWVHALLPSCPPCPARPALPAWLPTFLPASFCTALPACCLPHFCNTVQQ